MTFEYRDSTGETLTVEKDITEPFVVFHAPPNGVGVDVDHIEEVVAGIRDAARQAVGQPQADECPNCRHARHLPGTECEAGVEHGPKRWHRCLCLARPGAALACPPQMTCQGGTLGYSDIWYLQHGHRLIDEDGAISSEALRVEERGPAVGQQPTQQPATEACSPRVQWRVSLYDPVAEEWAPGHAFSDRERALERLHAAHIHSPRWADDNTPVKRRLVRETTTWTVEEDAR